MITGTCHCGDARFEYDGLPDRATACNCTTCRRYGALWAYGWDGDGVRIAGETSIYMHGDREIEFHHCPKCGCILWWRGAAAHPDGRHRIAVNLRLSDPVAVGGIPIRHFDGHDSWAELPDDGKTIRDMWF